MNCYNHPDRPAVTQCYICMKGLCKECADKFHECESNHILCDACYVKTAQDGMISVDAITDNDAACLSKSHLLGSGRYAMEEKYFLYKSFLRGLKEKFYFVGKIGFLAILCLSILVGSMLIYDDYKKGSVIVPLEVLEGIGICILISLFTALIVGIGGAWLEAAERLRNRARGVPDSNTKIIVTTVSTAMIVGIFKAFFTEFLPLMICFLYAPIYILYVLIRCFILKRQ